MPTPSPTTAPPRGPVRHPERALAPDLARGVMLLLIVLSNTAFHLWAARHGASGWHPVDGSTADKVVRFAMITTLDLRAYPLFAFLFGYGMMRLYTRQTEAGTAPGTASRLLRRRGLWLIVFGFAHAALLMAGDIMGSYGVASVLLCALFLRRTDRTILIGAAVALAVLVMAVSPALAAIVDGDLGRLAEAPSEASTVAYASGEGSWLAAAGDRLVTWAYVTGAGGLFSFPGHLMMLLGFWAARRRILERPQDFLPLLRWTAVLGIAFGWLTGLPSALAHTGLWTVTPDALAEGGVLPLIQENTGFAGGLGYVALFALIAHRIARRADGPGHAARALAALGKRSLSGYLAHSLLFAPVLAAWGLGFGAHLGSATMALFAIGVWLVTVVAAYALERAGRPGPADALLRRLVYGRAAPAGGPGTAGGPEGA